jgi:hypothetical protein
VIRTNFLIIYRLCKGTDIKYYGKCKDCNCPEILNEVCGVDGNTFMNKCFADCQNVKVLRNGKCFREYKL